MEPPIALLVDRGRISGPGRPRPPLRRATRCPLADTQVDRGARRRDRGVPRRAPQSLPPRLRCHPPQTRPAGAPAEGTSLLRRRHLGSAPLGQAPHRPSGSADPRPRGEGRPRATTRGRLGPPALSSLPHPGAGGARPARGEGQRGPLCLGPHGPPAVDVVPPHRDNGGEHRFTSCPHPRAGDACRVGHAPAQREDDRRRPGRSIRDAPLLPWPDGPGRL